MNTRRDELYDSITKKQVGFLFAAGGVIGVIIFLICYGAEAILVTNDGWLLKGQDLMQHYIGWKAYRQTPWQFPVGITEGLFYPEHTCVIYTDSIPLLAIFFKLLSPILPETFQYFGLWGVSCFILMGGLSAIILRKFTDRLYLCIAGSVFFSFSPYMFQRMYAHTALSGQWIILLAILLWVYKPILCNLKRKLISWGALLIIASLVHIYYVPMVMLFVLGSSLQDFLEKKEWKSNLITMLVMVIADLIVLASVGAFSVSASMEDGGLGVYSSNLNVFWNPLGKGWILNSLPFNQGQDEGYGYLGAGILLLCGLLLGLMFKSLYLKYKRDLETTTYNIPTHRFKHFINKYAFAISMSVVCFVAFVLAISPVIAYGNTVLMTIPWPDPIIKLLSIFRASGRFIWCVSYVIMFVVIISVCKALNDNKAVFLVISIALAIQICDLMPYAYTRREYTDSQKQLQIFISPEWDRVTASRKHLYLLPWGSVLNPLGADAVYATADFALDHDMSINYYVCARINYPKVMQNEQDMINSLNSQIYPKDTLFILDSKETGLAYGMTVEEIDGFTIGYY